MYFNKHFKKLFGEYMEAHIDPTITNDMKPRNCAKLLLWTTVNIQGMQKVSHINTKKVTKRRKK